MQIWTSLRKINNIWFVGKESHHELDHPGELVGIQLPASEDPVGGRVDLLFVVKGRIVEQNVTGSTGGLSDRLPVNLIEGGLMKKVENWTRFLSEKLWRTFFYDRGLHFRARDLTVLFEKIVSFRWWWILFEKVLTLSEEIKTCRTVLIDDNGCRRIFGEVMDKNLLSDGLGRRILSEKIGLSTNLKMSRLEAVDLRRRPERFWICKIDLFT